ncbi:hypothetical protein MHYP_G00270640 [Metynnis hypsauchen]
MTGNAVGSGGHSSDCGCRIRTESEEETSMRVFTHSDSGRRRTESRRADRTEPLGRKTRSPHRNQTDMVLNIIWVK